VTSDHSLPPLRKLSSERLRVREAHLLDEIRIDRPQRAFSRLVPRRTRSLVATALVLAAVAAAPALAFSTTVRELVGLKSPTLPSTGPALEAKLTSVIVHHRRVGAVISVKFSIGEPGKRPGTGIPHGSLFQILLIPKHGAPTRLDGAQGENGRYSATARVPASGIANIQIGGWLNRKGIPTAATGFWLPITIVNNPY
jgi:hypothetical protein